MECIFCNIVKGTIDANIRYQDDQVIAFDDVDPKAPTHILIIPRQHIATLNDLSPNDTNLMGHIVQVAKNLAKECGFAEEGYRILFNCNKGGGQAVFHIHLHLLGGRLLNWPPG